MTAYEMRISDWSSVVCSSDLGPVVFLVENILAEERKAPAVSLCECEAGVDKLDRAATRSRRVDDIPPDQPDARILETRRQRQVVAEVEIIRVRSEWRRVGQECFSTLKSGWSP